MSRFSNFNKTANRRAIASYIKILSEDESEEIPLLCRVQDVDRDNATCTCINLTATEEDDDIIYNVRMAPDNESPSIVVPAIDSKVIINYTNEYVPYIAMFSEIEEQVIHTTTYTTSENENLKQYIRDLLEAILNIQMMHPRGPTTKNLPYQNPQSNQPEITGVINSQEFVDLLNRLDNIFGTD